MFGWLSVPLVATLVITASSHSKLCHTDQTRPNDQDDQEDQDDQDDWDDQDDQKINNETKFKKEK